MEERAGAKRTQAAKNGRITLCAVMRNEERTVARMLASVADALGGDLVAVLLVDTGSTDETIAVSEETLRGLHKSGGIEWRIFEDEWVNFGVNRTRMLDQARTMSGAYLLLLDCDMTLTASGPVPDLEGAGYMLEVEGDASTAYWTTRLVSAAHEWKFVGSTHEVLQNSGGLPKLDVLTVHHHHDGGYRHDKFDRDRRLLEEAVRDDPTDARSAFYLAQTYRDLGSPLKAAKAYDRRAALGGWDEEVYFSLYQAGLLRRSIEGLLLAFESCPRRGEALYEVLGLMRQQEMWRTAHALATYGRDLEMPAGDVLFLEPWIYDWGLKFEYSITSYWVGDPEACVRMSEMLLGRTDLPPAFRTAAEQNAALGRAASA